MHHILPPYRSVSGPVAAKDGSRLVFADHRGHSRSDSITARLAGVGRTMPASAESRRARANAHWHVSLREYATSWTSAPEAVIALKLLGLAERGAAILLPLDDERRRLAFRVPGAQGIVYDTALPGVHHQELLRDLGLLPINRVAAAEKGARTPRRKDGRRVAKSVYVEDKIVPGPDSRAVSCRSMHGMARSG